MCILTIIKVNDPYYGKFRVIAFQRDENTRAKCQPLNYHPEQNDLIGLFNAKYYNSPFAIGANGDFAILLDLRLHENDTRRGYRDFMRGQFVKDFLTSDIDTVEFAKQKKSIEGTFPHIMYLSKQNQPNIYYCSDEEELLEVSYANTRISCFTTWTGDRHIRYYRKERIEHMVKEVVESFVNTKNQPLSDLIDKVLYVLSDTVQPTDNDPLPDLGKPLIYEKAVGSIRIPTMSLREGSVMGWMTRSSIVSIISDEHIMVKERVWEYAKTVDEIDKVKDNFTDSELIII